MKEVSTYTKGNDIHGDLFSMACPTSNISISWIRKVFPRLTKPVVVTDL